MIKLSKHISIVIPTYNEEASIGNLLFDIMSQEGSSNIDVYVADGNSLDNTIEICLFYQKFINLDIIQGGTVTQGRNAGLEKVKTPYVIFIDADVRLSNKFQLLDAYQKLQKANLVGSRIRSRSGVISNYAYMMFNVVNRIISLSRPFALGSFFGTQTNVIRSYGGWDESLVHGEDWVLSSKYSTKDYSLLKYPIFIDDRRLKKIGYFRMFKLLVLSAFHGEDYMRKDQGYWK